MIVELCAPGTNVKISTIHRDKILESLPSDDINVDDLDDESQSATTAPMHSKVKTSAPIIGTAQMDLDSSDGVASSAAQCLHTPERDLFVPMNSFSASLDVIGAFDASQHTLGSLGTCLNSLQ